MAFSLERKGGREKKKETVGISEREREGEEKETAHIFFKFYMILYPFKYILPCRRSG